MARLFVFSRKMDANTCTFESEWNLGERRELRFFEGVPI